MSRMEKTSVGRGAIRIAFAVFAVGLINGAHEAQAAPKKGAKPVEVVPGQFVVQLKRDRAYFNQAELERRMGGKIVDEVRPDMIVLQRAGRENPKAVARSLRSLSEVKIAEPNFIFRIIGAPNDTDYQKLWGLNNNGGLDSEGTRGLKGLDISAERAWEIQRGSKDVIVAVIDTGVDYTHPELANNMWKNEAEASGQPGVDDDGNGYIDDVHGMNFVTDKGDPKDDNGHGTHCAGTIGAEGNNSAGLVGVNWNVSIMAIKFLDSSGGGTLANAVKAIDYAKKSKATILSNSWGGAIVSDILEKAVEETREAGKLFIAAAGNDGANNDNGGTVPGGYRFENILSVAAVDNRGELASFSNYGTASVHVAAPGVNIVSTVLRGAYDTYSGTSMATPHVAGVAALLLANDPTLTYAQLKERIMTSARPLNSLKGKIQTGAMLDAYYALSGEAPPADPNDPSIWSEREERQLSSPHPYPDKAKELYTITVPGAKRISVHFSKFETESSYDKVHFQNASGETFGVWTGTQSGRFSPIIDGDTVTLMLTSDSSVNGYGFDVDYIAYEK